MDIPTSDEALLAECRIETFQAGGPGGQHQNRTESAVRLIHVPTGTRAIAREERSQSRNRVAALKRLRAKLEAAAFRAPERVPTRVPKGQKKKRLEGKRRRGDKKRLRRPPDEEGP